MYLITSPCFLFITTLYVEKVNSDIEHKHILRIHYIYTKDLEKVEKIINSNSPEEIKYIETNIKKFDIVKYISENHKKILEKDYCNLNLDIFKEIFKIIQNIKNNNNLDFHVPKKFDRLCYI